MAEKNIYISEESAKLRANEILLGSDNYLIAAIDPSGALEVVADFSDMTQRECGQFSKAIFSYMMDSITDSN